MSFTQLQEYLAYLMEKSIIKQTIISNDNGKVNKLFINTEKGNHLLEDIQKIMMYFE